MMVKKVEESQSASIYFSKQVVKVKESLIKDATTK